MPVFSFIHLILVMKTRIKYFKYVFLRAENWPSNFTSVFLLRFWGGLYFMTALGEDCFQHYSEVKCSPESRDQHSYKMIVDRNGLSIIKKLQVRNDFQWSQLDWEPGDHRRQTPTENVSVFIFWTLRKCLYKESFRLESFFQGKMCQVNIDSVWWFYQCTSINTSTWKMLCVL